jgi:hypothetical protein
LLVLALEWGGNEVAWFDFKAWGFLLGFGLLTIAFIVPQLRMDEK